MSPYLPAHHYIREADMVWGVLHILAKDLAGSGVKLREISLSNLWPVEERRMVQRLIEGKS